MALHYDAELWDEAECVREKKKKKTLSKMPRLPLPGRRNPIARSVCPSSPCPSTPPSIMLSERSLCQLLPKPFPYITPTQMHTQRDRASKGRGKSGRGVMEKERKEETKQ